MRREKVFLEFQAEITLKSFNSRPAYFNLIFNKSKSQSFIRSNQLALRSSKSKEEGGDDYLSSRKWRKLEHPLIKLTYFGNMICRILSESFSASNEGKLWSINETKTSLKIHLASIVPNQQKLFKHLMGSFWSPAEFQRKL